MANSFFNGNNPISKANPNANIMDVLLHFLLSYMSRPVILQKINVHKYHMIYGGEIRSLTDRCPYSNHLKH